MIKYQINHKIQYQNHKLLTLPVGWFGILKFLKLEFIHTDKFCILFFDYCYFRLIWLRA